ncbi:MAG: Ribonuclease P protein subunit p30 [Pycnora praestabilis]|nr:MAG: Ribonuclease P protein subunit p30 [Pycnora praestabilis]
MFYDLNVPWTAGDLEIQRTLAFLNERYNVVALTHTLSGKLPADLTCQIPSSLPFAAPSKLRVLRRCTLILSDPSQNHRLNSLNACYDILAIRPTNERALSQACQTLDCDLISIDLSVRHPYHFKHKTLSSALQRGIKFEICYGPGILAIDSSARRNLISNATQLIRATRGRGIVLSSEAKRAVGCRGPWDVINLAAVWGLGQERGREAVDTEARSVIVQAEMKRRSFRGVIDVVYGGEKKEVVEGGKALKAKGKGEGKRKADAMDGGAIEFKEATPLSKREQKRQAKKARFEAGQKPVSLAANGLNQPSKG